MKMDDSGYEKLLDFLFGTAAMASAKLLTDSYAMTMILRWIVSIAGGILLYMLSIKAEKKLFRSTQFTLL